MNRMIDSDINQLPPNLRLKLYNNSKPRDIERLHVFDEVALNYLLSGNLDDLFDLPQGGMFEFLRYYNKVKASLPAEFRSYQSVWTTYKTNFELKTLGSKDLMILKKFLDQKKIEVEAIGYNPNLLTCAEWFFTNISNTSEELIWMLKKGEYSPRNLINRIAGNQNFVPISDEVHTKILTELGFEYLIKHYIASRTCAPWKF